MFSSSTAYSEEEWPSFMVHTLQNLAVTDELESLSPIMDCQIANLSNDDTPQFYTACGRGGRSSLRILRHGLEVTEMAVSELPGNPSAIWTVRRNVNGTVPVPVCLAFFQVRMSVLPRDAHVCLRRG